MKIKHLLLSILTLVSLEVSAQFNIRDTTIGFSIIGATAGYEIPGGDLADRFGSNFHIGGSYHYKFRTNWIIGFEGNFFFSDKVKENHMLDQFMTADGYILSGEGQYATVNLTERGWKFYTTFGKIFPVIGPNKNSGLMATFGAGYIQHKIFIDTPGNVVPYLEDEYRKGFDRFTNGPMLNQFLGYVNFSNSKRINFYAGIDLTEGFTQNRRTNFDTGLKDETKRFDLMIGIHIGWVFPLYKRVADQIYFN